MLQRQGQGLGKLGKVRNHGGGLPEGSILLEGDKIEVLPGQKTTDVFGCGPQGIVGGDGDEHRTAIAQMTFGGHGDGAVGNAVGQLCQGVASTGGNHQHIQQLFWANWLHLGKGVERGRAAKLLDSLDMFPGGAEAAVYRIGGFGKMGIRV